MTECSRCLFTSDIAKILADGECEYCKIHDRLEANANPDDLPRILDQVIKKGKGKKYDCLIGISGGLDSSTLLYMAVKEWGLRPLVIHFDNWMNHETATDNMNKLLYNLPVDSITYKVNRWEYDQINARFLYYKLPDADIPNDIAMTKLMYETAEKYGIKYILNGHCFRTEGSTPAAWTYMDAKYIQSVAGFKLLNFPLFKFSDQLRAWVKGIKQIRPFHYLTIKQRRRFEKMMVDYSGWQPYGPKHAENHYTAWVGYTYLPQEHKIDKSIVYKSALIRSGQITKDEAKAMTTDTDYKYPHGDHPNYGVEMPCRRESFARYNFKRYRPLIWVLMKAGAVPYTFYKKYCF
jgi:hypothetical protein